MGERLSPPEGEEGQRQVGLAEILKGLLVGLKDSPREEILWENGATSRNVGLVSIELKGTLTFQDGFAITSL